MAFVDFKEYGGRILKVGMAHRETGSLRGFRYGEHHAYSPMGDDNTAMRSNIAASQNSRFVAADMYGQHSYDGSYSSNFNTGSSNMYSHGTNSASYAVASNSYDFGQVRSSYSIDADSYQENRQYSGYGGYGGYGGYDNKYGDGFITGSSNY